MSISRSVIKIISIGVSAGILIGCGGGGDAGGAIDLAKYMPDNSTRKQYTEYKQYPDDPEPRSWQSIETIRVSEADGDKTIKRYREEVHEDILFRTDIVQEGTIHTILPASDTHVEVTGETNRYVDIGDWVYESNVSVTIADGINLDFISKCKVVENLDTYTPSGYDYSYNGDILKLQCLLETSSFVVGGVEYPPSYYLTYRYLKKDVGMIAETGKHCMIEDGTSLTDDRNLETCPDDDKMFDDKFFTATLPI